MSAVEELRKLARWAEEKATRPAEPLLDSRGSAYGLTPSRVERRLWRTVQYEAERRADAIEQAGR